MEKFARGIAGIGLAVGASVGLQFVLGSTAWAEPPKSGASFLKFPSEFRWCVATAPHQVDGDNIHSDWWHFEQKTDPCPVARCERSGKATDHWNRLEEDTGLLQQLNVKEYRLGVEWARLEPTQGVWDYEAAAHVVKEIRLLRNAGIRPMVTLQHFTLPQWVAEKGGWTWAGIPDAFARYTEFVYQLIGAEVGDWVTINEPLVHLSGGYILGATPPGAGTPHVRKAPDDWKKKVQWINSVEECGDLGKSYLDGVSPGKEEFGRLVAPARGLLLSHARAYRSLHRAAARAGRSVRVGIAHHFRRMEPRNYWNPLDLYLTSVLDRLWNWTVPNALQTGWLKIQIPTIFDYKERLWEVEGTQDFIGVNFYTRDTVAFAWENGFSVRIEPKPRALVSDLGWDIAPKGFYRILMKAHRKFPQLPILVTENGIADCTDRYRGVYLQSHLRELYRAIQDGAPVENYCHWSLMDNFEWVEGFAPRFGLYEVNYQTFERKPRASAILFSQFARDNGFWVGPNQGVVEVLEAQPGAPNRVEP